jgi:hypothetical protein
MFVPGQELRSRQPAMPSRVSASGLAVTDPFRVTIASDIPQAHFLLEFYRIWCPGDVEVVHSALQARILLLPLLCYSATILNTLKLGNINENELFDLHIESLQLLRKCVSPDTDMPAEVICRALTWMVMCSMVRADHQATTTHLHGLRLVLTHFECSLFNLPVQVRQMITFCDITSRIRSLQRPLFMSDHVQRPKVKTPRSYNSDMIHGLVPVCAHLLSHGTMGQQMIPPLGDIFFSIESALGLPAKEIAEVQSMYYDIYNGLLDLLAIDLSTTYTCLHQFRKSFVTTAWSLALVGPIKIEFPELFQSLLEEFATLCCDSCERLAARYNDTTKARQSVCPIFSRFTSNQPATRCNDLEMSCTATCLQMHGHEMTPKGPMFALKCRIYGPIFVYNPLTPTC